MGSHGTPTVLPYDFYNILLRCRRSFDVSIGLDEASCRGKTNQRAELGRLLCNFFFGDYVYLSGGFGVS